jgi:TPP-dependent indolepyruvate ferredoxin oxidoreductase alpha subunit
MSKYLIDEKFKDPSAVMIGSVLEEHLRQLCYQNKITVETIKNEKLVPKKADLLNSELATATIYNKLDQKSITSWLDLRNKAAHGNYDEYTLEQVKIMYQGVKDFISRTI